MIPTPLRHLVRALGLAALLLALSGSMDAFAQTSPFHPTFPLLDVAGANVLESGRPVSTMNTCGACHDAVFIEGHSFHADVSLSTLSAPGSAASGRPWDIGDGYFGQWNPLIYRYLSPQGDPVLDLTTPEWIQRFTRHAGGGPAVRSRDGRDLPALTPSVDDPETTIVNPQTGQAQAWDWQSSGTVEMNCFLCHIPQPNNKARIAALSAGDFSGANTATLLGTGLVDQSADGWEFQSQAFDADGNLLPEFVTVQDPRIRNCAQCHGYASSDAATALALAPCNVEDWSTYTTGQVVSPQRLADSALNLAGKEQLTRSWDIHAERVLSCTDCHFSLNNPVYYQDESQSRLEHLTFDPRRIDLGEYLYRPLHQFAKGNSAQGMLAPELDDTLRRCESCHDYDAAHDWLPYQQQHRSAVACETCHIPELNAPAIQSADWTVLTIDGSPALDCRGLTYEEPFSPVPLLTGYQPVLLQRQNADGSSKLFPYNLVASWYWVYGDPQRPVPYRYLEAAWLDGAAYHAEVVALFDADGNGEISTSELKIDTPEKEAAIAARLIAQGLDTPHTTGEVQPYSIHHSVAGRDSAIRDCRVCHGDKSRVTQSLLLASAISGGVTPDFVGNLSTRFTGDLIADDAGRLLYAPNAANDSLYILGHNRVAWVDLIGLIAFFGTLLGISVHGGLRFVAAMRRPRHAPRVERVYMYGVYERLWHWLQTAAILLLIATGLVIHRPDLFGAFSFRYMVLIHNILAAILVVNAALSLFYHLASGEIRQFLPRPYGFFDQAIEQAKFYLGGIFRGGEHPFEKTPDRKLNPLQQLTYFAILNVLLPLQILTGLLMWGAQRFPGATDAVGGLPFLGPFHTLIAWLFAAFIVLHVYLTTTGPTPLAGIRAMIVGWDEVEVHGRSQEAKPLT